MAILIPVLSALIIGVVAMSLVVSMVVSSSTADLTDRLMNARVNEYLNQFSAISNDGYAMVRTVGPIVNDIRTSSQNPREEIIRTFEGIMNSNYNVIGIWTAWEPNAFDGKDSEYKSKNEYHDESGRFVPYVFREGNSIILSPLLGYDDPVAGEYYQGPKSTGKPYITDPYSYEIQGKSVPLYTISAPILQDGKVIGAIGIDINLENLITVMNSGEILDDGYLFVISPGGLISTHRDPGLILKSYKDVWLKNFSADIDAVLQKGGIFHETGYSDVSNSNMEMVTSSVAIGDTGKYWAVCGVVPEKTAEAASTTLIWIVTGMGAALIIVAGLATFLLISRNLRKLPAMTAMAEKIAVGDVRFENQAAASDTARTKNEITLLERSFIAIADSIKEQSDLMKKIADGDYSVTAPVRCDADVMNQSINSMIDRTNLAMGDIRAATEQVAMGSKQIADGAQSLAQGSTEQAATVQELSASTTEISEKTKANADMASKAAALAHTIKQSAEKGSHQMDEMMSAVNEITQASQSIGKVIKVIDDIAFQTNILALNAAVEAARAGTHGKGFAVVAEEVRNLAAKSAEAAKDTGGLIANSIEKAELGAGIAKETAESLSEIVSGINESNQIVSEIAISSEAQAGGITQINTGIDQVAQVVQQNSATAEQSAAASQELSGQSAMLEQLITQFKLKNSGTPPRNAPPRELSMETGFAMNEAGYSGYSDKY